MASIDAGGWVLIIGAVSLGLTNIVALVLQFFSSRKVALATAIRDEKMDSMARVSRDIHTLVNSNMGVQLKLNAVLSRRMATLTSDPEDYKAAVMAEAALQKHIEQQRIVDAEKTK